MKKDKRSVKRIREDAFGDRDLKQLAEKFKVAEAEGSIGIPAAAIGMLPAGGPGGIRKVKGAARKGQARVIAAAKELSFVELNRTRAANAEGFFPDKFDKDGDLLKGPDKDLTERFKIEPPKTTTVEGL